MPILHHQTGTLLEHATCGASFIAILESNGSCRSVTAVNRSFPTLRGINTKDCGQQGRRESDANVIQTDIIKDGRIREEQKFRTA